MMVNRNLMQSSLSGLQKMVEHFQFRMSNVKVKYITII